jgi:hypothetical protein
VSLVATQQMINKGASRTIPEIANIISTNLFEFSPIGRDDEISANRKSLVSTKPFIWVLLKNNFKKDPLKSTFFLLPFFNSLMGGAQSVQACNVSKLSLS